MCKVPTFLCFPIFPPWLFTFVNWWWVQAITQVGVRWLANKHLSLADSAPHSTALPGIFQPGRQEAALIFDNAFNPHLWFENVRSSLGNLGESVQKISPQCVLAPYGGESSISLQMLSDSDTFSSHCFVITCCWRLESWTGVLQV